jgi:hypothetical protein
MAFSSSSLAGSLSAAAAGSACRTGMAVSIALTTCGCHQTQDKTFPRFTWLLFFFQGSPSKERAMLIGEDCIHQGPTEMQIPQLLDVIMLNKCFKLNAIIIMFFEVRNFLPHGLQ